MGPITPTISFTTDCHGALDVQITTDRLLFHPVKNEQISTYAQLFADQDVMQKYCFGIPWSLDKTISVINKWVERWQKGIPFSAFSVANKTTHEFIGLAILGYSSLPGTAEIAGIMHKAHWNNKYGTEAADALVNYYAPLLREKKYALNHALFNTIGATARIDNLFSARILQKSNFQVVTENEKFGARRYFFKTKIFTRCVTLIAQYGEISDENLKEIIERIVTLKTLTPPRSCDHNFYKRFVQPSLIFLRQTARYLTSAFGT